MTPDEKIDQLRTELKVYGFAAAKEIARLQRWTDGKMPCPMCGQTLKFRTAAGNNDFAAKCEREGCINMME